jgi:hypothetical protein|uniref:Uncharacterized protein n=2 Tax=Picea TaxID=3328 RepID=A0A101M461_PICGL|nr:hypothetical protein ABT39_MTgene348 [Picea glauca]QHR90146.1 hypothetical protein Q903MT_gene4169 [Picea sitchensis]
MNRSKLFTLSGREWNLGWDGKLRRRKKEGVDKMPKAYILYENVRPSTRRYGAEVTHACQPHILSFDL